MTAPASRESSNSPKPAHRVIAQNIRLDKFHLAIAPTEFRARMIDNAPALYRALKRIAATDIERLDTNDAEHDALFDAVETARDAIAEIECEAAKPLAP